MADGPLRPSSGGPVSDINNRSSGVILEFAASEGRFLRVMMGGGAKADGDDTLVVYRGLCDTLLPLDNPALDPCEDIDSYWPYDLRIDLARVDPSTIASHDSAGSLGERGSWVQASCRGGYACAFLTPPPDASGQAERQVLMLSLMEKVGSPRLRIPCEKGNGCDLVASAFRSLVEDAVKRAGNAPGGGQNSGKGIVGIWDFESPFSNGWVTEFRADGTFVFNNRQSVTQGTYWAKDGELHQAAPAFNFEDDGTYRFLDNNTLELTGKYGTTTWKRRGGGK